jgi:hypothetical protein
MGAGSQKAEVRRRDTKDRTQEVVEFARSRLGFFPDRQQEELLRSSEGSNRQVTDLPHNLPQRRIVNCTRQWGKSTVAAVVAVHRAYFRAKSLVVVACPTEKQSAELVWKARDFMTKLGLRQRRDGSNRISLRLPNGSRIVGIPGKEATLRGFSAVSLLIIDEASRVDDSVYKALRPMLAVGNGDLWLLSTPFGRRGFLRELGGRKRGLGADGGACNGVLADHGRLSGAGAQTDGGFMVPAGVFVRVYRRGAPDVRKRFGDGGFG